MMVWLWSMNKSIITIKYLYWLTEYVYDDDDDDYNYNDDWGHKLLTYSTITFKKS